GRPAAEILGLDAKRPRISGCHEPTAGEVHRPHQVLEAQVPPGSEARGSQEAQA
ncbi:unnamed protein product, partial [Symbiodinium sp. KB8]